MRVSGATGDVFGIGGYRLLVQPLADSAVTLPTLELGDYGGGTSAVLPDGLRLLATTPGYVEHTYYETADRLDQARPGYTYSVRSADVGPGRVNVMSVVVSSPDPTARFLVSVLDPEGRRSRTPRSSRKAASTRFRCLRSSRPGTTGSRCGRRTRSIRGERSPSRSRWTSPRTGSTWRRSSTTHSAGQGEALRDLQVSQSQEVHFQLSATDWSARAATGVRMTITDTTGRVVYALSAADGATRSGDVFLDAGRYTVRFSRAAQGRDATPVMFQLSGIGLSEPLGPQCATRRGRPRVPRPRDRLGPDLLLAAPRLGRRARSLFPGAAARVPEVVGLPTASRGMPGSLMLPPKSEAGAASSGALSPLVFVIEQAGTVWSPRGVAAERNASTGSLPAPLLSAGLGPAGGLTIADVVFPVLKRTDGEHPVTSPPPLKPGAEEENGQPGEVTQPAAQGEQDEVAASGPCWRAFLLLPLSLGTAVLWCCGWPALPRRSGRPGLLRLRSPLSRRRGPVAAA